MMIGKTETRIDATTNVVKALLSNAGLDTDLGGKEDKK